MRKEELNRLLDSIYELEGLVHLAISRDDEPAMLPELIVRKSRELNMLARQTAGLEELSSEPEASEKVQPVEPLHQESEEVEPLRQESEEVVSHDTWMSDEEQPPIPVISPVDITEEDEEPAPSAAEKVSCESEKKSEKKAYGFDDYVEPRGRLVFSVNDRYRFKRELFKSSDVEFNTTLSLVASMDGYEEAEDYFLNELQWDEKSPDVIDFLEILKNYYK